MSSIFLFAQDFPYYDASTFEIQGRLNEKLKDISDQIKRDGVSIPDVLRPLIQHPISQCVIGPSHLAFRLEDGRVCRVSYSLRSDRAPQKLEVKRRNSSQVEPCVSVRDGSSGRTGSGQYNLRPYRSPLSVLSRTSRGTSFLRELQRQGVYLARPLSSQIPASEVPENLIEECQTVLEGKSRQVIIRELQHTNLDVNMAVNNLLSRDDEAEQSNSGPGDAGAGLDGLGAGSDEWDDEPVDFLSFFEYPDSHILLDSDGVIPDEPIEPPTSPRHRDLSAEYDYGFLTDSRKRRRMESNLTGRNTDAGARRNESVTGRSGVGDNSSVTSVSNEIGKTADGFARHFVQLGDQLEFWPNPDNQELDLRFSHIAALHSELVGLSIHGELHQWRWSESQPFPPTATSSAQLDFKPTALKKSMTDSWPSWSRSESNSPRLDLYYYHPRTVGLGLLDEQVVKLSGCATRATVMTASGKFATWIDESLTRLLPVHTSQGASQSRLLCFEHRATAFNELHDEIVLDLHTAPLITTVQCKSGAVYWWGVYPPYLRQRTIEKTRLHRVNQSSRDTNAGHKSGDLGRSSGIPRTSSENSEPASRGGGRSLSSIHEVTPGSFVRMKSAPIFHAGAIGFSVVGGVPKVGTLLEDAWKLSDVCRFRVNSSDPLSGGQQFPDGYHHHHVSPLAPDDCAQHLLTCPHAIAAASSGSYATHQNVSGGMASGLGLQACTSGFPSAAASPNPTEQAGSSTNNLTFQEMPPPPSPASSTCSDQSGPVLVSPGTFKRKKAPSTSGERSERSISDNELGCRSTRGRSVDRDTSNSSTLAVKRPSSAADSSADSVHKSQSNFPVMEEDWCLTDVIFVEDGRTQPIGIVLKVDGNIAAVKFLKDQERACLASNCMYSPVCGLVNSIVNPANPSQSSPLSSSCFSGSSVASSAAYASPTIPDPMAWVNDCRLLRKDDLAIVRYADSSRVPEFVQRTPRRVFQFPHHPRSQSESKGVSRTPPASHPKLLTIAPENNRIHVIVDLDTGSAQEQHISYHVYNLSGKLISHHKLAPVVCSQQPDAESLAETQLKVSLVCPSEHPLLLRDASGLVLPLFPSNKSGGATDSLTSVNSLLDLPPIQCASFAWRNVGRSGSVAIGSSMSSRQGSKTSSSEPQQQQQHQSANGLFGVVIVQDLTLMHHVLRANDTQVERLLSAESESSALFGQRLASEMVDGQRNLLHMAVAMCAPQSNRETSSEWATKLEPVLSGPANFSASPAPFVEKAEVVEKRPSISIDSGVRPSSTFWSTIARSTANQNPLSMHELFIRSSIEAAAVAAAAAASASSQVTNNVCRSDDREPTRRVTANGTNFWHLPPIRKDELTRRVASYRIVRLLLESRHLRPHLSRLLTARSSENLTPFMLAVKCRAYNVARFLYLSIQSLFITSPDAVTTTAISGDAMKDFLFPSGARQDDSPLFLLCRNDTCSFTWTGPDHIKQDIFECRTCGLMDSLCCCTECARVCHRGHDCRLKRTSPTAYCDCWEKCRCQSLVAGAQPARHELFYRLLQETDLIDVLNSKSEHVMLFLAKCLERQLREQKQHHPTRRRISSLTSRSTNANASGPNNTSSTTAPSSGWDGIGSGQNSSTPEEPEHDLDPPRFARDALELALDCPSAVHSVLRLDEFTTAAGPERPHLTSAASFGDENLLFAQGGTTQLDDFVFTTVCKCPQELVDTLISTLNRHMHPDITGSVDSACQSNNTADRTRLLTRSSKRVDPSPTEMQQVAGRFIRSVARIYASLSLESSADHKKKPTRILLSQPTPLDVCRHIFSRLAPVALAELPALAVGLLTPLRTGTLRPSLPFSLITQTGDVMQGLEQLFTSERITSTRHQLLESLERTDGVTSAGSISTGWHHSLARNNEYRRINATPSLSLPSSSTFSDSNTAVASRRATGSHSSRPTVVTSLHVNLVIPSSTATTSVFSLADASSTDRLGIPRETATPSPPVSSSIDNPSLLTLQMQSTICDIDRDVYSTNASQEVPMTDHESRRLTPINLDSELICHTESVSAIHNVTSCDSEEFSTERNDGGGFVRFDPIETSPVHLGAESIHALRTTDQSADNYDVPHATESGDWCPPYMPNCSTSRSYSPLRLASASPSRSRRHFSPSSDTNASESSENVTKRRRTMHEPPSSPTHSIEEHNRSYLSHSTELIDEDGNTVPFSLLETENPASQASSTGATIATIGGSTLDTLDAASDVTNCSVDTACNAHLDIARGYRSALMSLNAASELSSLTVIDSNEPTEFSYTRLLSSEIDGYGESDRHPNPSTCDPPQVSTAGSDEASGLARRSEAAVTFPNDDASDGQVSEYEDDEDDDDAEEGEDDGDDNDDDDEDENETDEEDNDEDGYGDDADEILDGDDDEDDDNDDSSHHSDASSADAGSRSTSPTWIPWSHNSVFSRLSSRSSAPASTAEESQAPVSSSSRRTNEAVNGSSSSLLTTLASVSTASAGPPLRSTLTSSRRTVQSVVSLLPSTAPSSTAPILVVPGSGAVNTSTTSETPKSSNGAPLTSEGCVTNTQAHLARAFGRFMRLIADLIVELREDACPVNVTLRRCTSAPTATMIPPSSAYAQQRQLPIYTPVNESSNSDPPISTSNVHSHTLLLSSPLSTANLASFIGRPLGNSSDLQSPIFQSSHVVSASAPFLGSTTAHATAGLSSLGRVTSAFRSNYEFRTHVLEQELAELAAALGVAIIPIWRWLAHGLDNLEAQLRFSFAWNCRFKRTGPDARSLPLSSTGTSVTSGGCTSRPEHSTAATTSGSGHSRQSTSTGRASLGRWSGGNNPRTDAPIDSANSDGAPLTQRSDFLSYLFSLMRASGGDHGDSAPFISPSAHKHLAYVLDALLYFFKAFESTWPSGLTRHLLTSRPAGVSELLVAASALRTCPIAQCSTAPTYEGREGLPKTNLGAHVTQREDAFFRRSESILSLSGLGLDLIDTPLSEALPLALQPQRLHPSSSRTELFGCARYFTGNPEDISLHGSLSYDLPLHMNKPSSLWGDSIARGGHRAVLYADEISNEDDVDKSTITHLTRRQLCGGSVFLDSIGHSATLLSRWCLSLEFFGRHFSNDVGAEYRSYIPELGGFTVKEARFRKQMERLRMIVRRDLTLEVERERSSLILATVKQLNAEYAKRQSQSTCSSSGGSLNAPPTGIGRYAVNYTPVGPQHSSSDTVATSRQSGYSPSPIAVALLLGTTTDSPLLGTLFGASPAPASPLTNNSQLIQQAQSGLLSSHRLKVAFRDEPGEGSGVARSFFTAFSEAVLSPEPLPQLTALLQTTSTSSNTPSSQQNAHVLLHHRHYTSLSRSQSTARSLAMSDHFPLIVTPANSNVAGRTGPSSAPLNSRTTESTVHGGSSPTVSVSFYPYQSQARPTTRRARTSAWRRAGGLSAGAPPFYPTATVTASTTQAAPATNSPPSYSQSHSGLRVSIQSLPSSPTRSPSTTVASDDCLPLLGPSPGSSPSNIHGTQEGSSRALLLRSSVLPVSIRSAIGEPTCSADSSASETSLPNSVGNRLYSRVQLFTRSEELSARITGMLLELPPTEHATLLTDEDALRNRVEEARAVLTMSDANEYDTSGLDRVRSPLTSSATQPQQPILERLVNWREMTQSAEPRDSETTPTAPINDPPAASTETDSVTETTTSDPERVSLFWQPGLQGYYFPRAVPGTNISTVSSVDAIGLAARYSIYRGIGRVIGLCLLTNETCPLHFNRPVLNYILGRVLHWHDFAFYDPTTYEGLRQLLQTAASDTEGSVSDYHLTFSLIPALEEGGVERGSDADQQSTQVYCLVPGGDEIDVNDANVYEFVKRYTEFKMIEAVREPLEQLKQGVFDVLPKNALDGLSAEDLRLLLNGAGDIDVEVLASYTTFHDETGSTSATTLGKAFENSGSSNHLDKVSRLKRWFWNTVRAMDTKQRQNLLYFWTSSPNLPASAQGFQPMPSITIRPADDHHLPSAHTCTSRLYLPLYSSKHILREKLLQAIEIKSFGFV